VYAGNAMSYEYLPTKNHGLHFQTQWVRPCQFTKFLTPLSA